MRVNVMFSCGRNTGHILATVVLSALQSGPVTIISIPVSQSEAEAMTTGPNRILDEFAKLMTDAAGAAQGVRREVETAFHAQAERFFNSMDIVQREEFEAVRDMALKARAQNEELAARLAVLEARLATEAGEPTDENAPK